jgi:hypothetical protein
MALRKCYGESLEATAQNYAVTAGASGDGVIVISQELGHMRKKVSCRNVERLRRRFMAFLLPSRQNALRALMEAIPLLVSHQDATRSACGAACFMRVLSHFICVAVCRSQALTVSKSSRSRTP